QLQDRLDGCKRVGRGCEPWFYQRLGPRAGLTLFRVLREGLQFSEDLGGLMAGRTSVVRRPPAPMSRNPAAAGGRNAPTPVAVGIAGASARPASVGLHQRVLRFSRREESRPRAFSRASPARAPRASRA